MPYQFVANLHGLRAVATVELEQLYSYAVLSGTVTSPNARYTFTADIYGDGGYGDMVDHTSGDRFRIQIQSLHEGGFVLVANPFEGVSSTSYVFQRAG